MKNEILIVDDEEFGRETLESLLINGPYRLLFASDGFEMLKMAREHQPDLILLDVMMPGMDGFDACIKLREDPIISETPVIMVTALDDKDSRIRGIEAGADDFISKPFDRLELRTRVKTITKLNRYRKLVTERKKFEWVINQAYEGYLILKTDNTIDYVNETAIKLLNISESLDNKNFLKIAQKNFRLEPAFLWEEWTEDNVAGLKDNHIRFLIQPESETESELWIKVSTYSVPGDPGHILVILIDVTSEMSNNHDLRTFHNMIIHKFRTPFNGLLLGLRMLSKDIFSKLDEEQKELCTITLDSAERYYNSIESILEYLNFSDVIKNREGINIGSIHEIAEHICNDLQISLLRVNTKKDSDNVKLIFDENILELILAKILDNSKKFHPDQNPEVEVDISVSDSGMVLIKIGDNGVNLSQKQLLEMWGPYYQIDKSFSGEVSGMGLGLTYIASTMWHVGGRFSSYNQKDRVGIIIELEIPVTN